MVDTLTFSWKQIATQAEHHLPPLKAGGRVPNQVGHSSKDDAKATQGRLTQCWQQDKALDVLELSWIIPKCVHLNVQSERRRQKKKQLLQLLEEDVQFLQRTLCWTSGRSDTHTHNWQTAWEVVTDGWKITFKASSLTKSKWCVLAKFQILQLDTLILTPPQRLHAVQISTIWYITFFPFEGCYFAEKKLYWQVKIR